MAFLLSSSWVASLMSAALLQQRNLTDGWRLQTYIPGSPPTVRGVSLSFLDVCSYGRRLPGRYLWRPCPRHVLQSHVSPHHLLSLQLLLDHAHELVRPYVRCRLYGVNLHQVCDYVRMFPSDMVYLKATVSITRLITPVVSSDGLCVGVGHLVRRRSHASWTAAHTWTCPVLLLPSALYCTSI